MAVPTIHRSPSEEKKWKRQRPMWIQKDRTGRAFLGEEQAQDPEWWSEEDFAWWSKRKKGKKGFSKGDDGFQKGGFLPARERRRQGLPQNKRRGKDQKGNGK